MLYNLAFVFMTFIIYAFIGKIGEIILCSYINKRFTDRGFFLGPYIPIWGIGALILGPILNIYISNPIMVFFIGMLVGTILEFIISYIGEKIYDARWWDYSNVKFNLYGRVCLPASIAFGVISVFYLYILNPYIVKVLESNNNDFLIQISGVILVVFIVDVIASQFIAFRLKSQNRLKNIDCTEDVKSEIRRMLFRM